MIDEDSWTRGLYEPGGGDAMLCYFLFGSFGDTIDFSFDEYGIVGIPPEIHFTFYDLRDDPNPISEISEYFATKRFASSESALYEKVLDSPSCIKLLGTFNDPPSLSYLRETVGTITGILDNGGVAIFDVMSLSWFSTQEWRNVFFIPGMPSPCKHVKIILSESENRAANSDWLHTRGMRKFGRPDLSIEDVRKSQTESVSYILNCLIEDQSFGLLVTDGQKIELKDLSCEASCITCHYSGSMDNPDFNNVHLELVMKYFD